MKYVKSIIDTETGQSYDLVYVLDFDNVKLELTVETSCYCCKMTASEALFGNVYGVDYDRVWVPSALEIAGLGIVSTTQKNDSYDYLVDTGFIISDSQSEVHTLHVPSIPSVISIHGEDMYKLDDEMCNGAMVLCILSQKMGFDFDDYTQFDLSFKGGFDLSLKIEDKVRFMKYYTKFLVLRGNDVVRSKDI